MFSGKNVLRPKVDWTPIYAYDKINVQLQYAKTCDKAMRVYARVKSDTMSRWQENALLDRKPHESSESVMPQN